MASLRRVRAPPLCLIFTVSAVT